MEFERDSEFINQMNCIGKTGAGNFFLKPLGYVKLKAGEIKEVSFMIGAFMGNGDAREKFTACTACAISFAFDKSSVD